VGKRIVCCFPAAANQLKRRKTWKTLGFAGLVSGDSVGS